MSPSAPFAWQYNDVCCSAKGSEMINLTTMTIQFIDCEPDGIRICRIEGESLVTVVVPRELLSQASQLPQMPRRGIYYLLDEDHGILSRVYAGQTIQGISRLESHKSRKDFWNKAVMFLDEDWNIDRDVLDALEAKAIGYVQEHGSYETDNKQVPSPRLSPYKEQRVEDLHAKILFRMRALGYDLDRADDATIVPGPIFHTKRNGVLGRGLWDSKDGRFTVLAGSEVDLDKKIIKNRTAQDLRAQMFDGETGRRLLPKDATFSSPSAAAVFVLGGSANGWIEWLDEYGRPLDTYRNHE